MSMIDRPISIAAISLCSGTGSPAHSVCQSVLDLAPITAQQVLRGFMCMVGRLVVLVNNIAARTPTLQRLTEQCHEKVMEDVLPCP